jgi:sugar lactone lactonase YvrE
MLSWDELSGQVGVFRSPASHANGNTIDRQGRLVTCEHGARRVTRTEHDGSITVIADRFEGRRFNSPNDVVVKSDDSIWFTDPTYGIDSDYEGHKAEMELDGCHVYRVDPADGRITRVAEISCGRTGSRSRRTSGGSTSPTRGSATIRTVPGTFGCSTWRRGGCPAAPCSPR